MSDRTVPEISDWFDGLESLRDSVANQDALRSGDADEPLVRGSGLSGHVRRWLLIDGNRWLLALLLAAVFFLDAGDVPGTTLGVDNLVVTVTAAATVSVTPFLLLVSYVLRIVTITEQTLTTGSFVLREDERPGE